MGNSKTGKTPVWTQVCIWKFWLETKNGLLEILAGKQNLTFGNVGREVKIDTHRNSRAGRALRCLIWAKDTRRCEDFILGREIHHHFDPHCHHHCHYDPHCDPLCDPNCDLYCSDPPEASGIWCTGLWGSLVWSSVVLLIAILLKQVGFGVSD